MVQAIFGDGFAGEGIFFGEKLVKIGIYFVLETVDLCEL